MTDIDILKHAQEYIQELSQGNRLSDGRASSGERYYLSAKNTNAAKRYIGIIKSQIGSGRIRVLKKLI